MRVIPMATVVGNTVRVRVTWANWDDGTPLTVATPEVKCIMGNPGRVVDTLTMSVTGTPGMYEAFWTPTIPGVYDLHATAIVDGAPEAAHQLVTVRA